MSSLPSQTDFEAFDGWLDQVVAWKNFGGLNLTEAYEKFCSHPERYQEDFMFMGTKAFLFYMPVIEKFILNQTPADEFDDMELHILGCAFESQIEENSSMFNNAHFETIKNIMSVIHEKFPPLLSAKEMKRVNKQWKRVEKLIKP